MPHFDFKDKTKLIGRKIIEENIVEQERHITVKVWRDYCLKPDKGIEQANYEVYSMVLPADQPVPTFEFLRENSDWKANMHITVKKD